MAAAVDLAAGNGIGRRMSAWIVAVVFLPIATAQWEVVGFAVDRLARWLGAGGRQSSAG